MPEYPEKILGHEVLLESARAIIEAPPGLLETEQMNLELKLELQVVARRDDFIPDAERHEVASKVVRAMALRRDNLTGSITDFAISNVGEEDFKQILAQLDESWVILECPECSEYYVVTRACYDQRLQDLQETLECLAEVCLPEVIARVAELSKPIWQSDTKDNAAESDHKCCPECQGKGKYISVVADGNEGYIRCQTCKGEGWISPELYERLTNPPTPEDPFGSLAGDESIEA
jgi:hypothetical protein